MYKKGYNFERQLKKELENKGWKVIRSGGSKKPDLIAGKKGKIIVVECKTTKADTIYVSPEEVENLKAVAHEFNADCMYAVKKNNVSSWILVGVDEFRKKGKLFSLSLNFDNKQL